MTVFAAPSDRFLRENLCTNAMKRKISTITDFRYQIKVRYTEKVVNFCANSSMSTAENAR